MFEKLAAARKSTEEDADGVRDTMTQKLSASFSTKRYLTAAASR